MDIPMPNIIAVVAVLEIHAEIKAVDGAEGEQDPRRPSPDPRQRQHGVREAPVEPVQEDGAREDERADEEKHQRVGERREHLLRRRHAAARTHIAAPSSAVTGIGSTSVIQSTTTAAITAARRCASDERVENGWSRIERKASGARMAPTRRRRLPGSGSEEGSVIEALG